MFKTNKNLIKYAILGAAGFLGLMLLLYTLPPIREKVDIRVKIWTTQIKFALRPPEEEVFIPQKNAQIEPVTSATLDSAVPTITSTPEPSPTTTPTLTGPTPTPTNTATPTATPIPLPESVLLEGVKYQHQHGLWNYCGPATLVTGLSYWGINIDRLEAGAYLRGGHSRPDDKNIMPYEMQDYVTAETGLKMLVRVGGDLELMKSLLAAGFPVIVEKDDTVTGVGWLGHYLLLIGYDETKGEFITMDTYRGEGMRYSYETLQTAWRAFNYTFLLPYPAEEESRVFEVLGSWGDATWAAQRALQTAQQEAITLTGRDQYFAWFNIGSSNIELLSYFDAAAAYDQAFTLYANLPEDVRPWRILWYQTGPYKAYYYTNRFYDVLNLAEQTLEVMDEPILEESFYWRALAKEAIGDWEGAVADMQETVRLNPTFGPGLSQLQRMTGGG